MALYLGTVVVMVRQRWGTSIQAATAREARRVLKGLKRRELVPGLRDCEIEYELERLGPAVRAPRARR